MMYHQKMVLAIKSSGKVLREVGDEVRIPFGSEYSLLIKNLNTVRAIVNVYIDGTDVVPGGLIVNANSEVDLERYLNNGNLNAGNKFKFIERTEHVEDTRGIKAEDGIVKIEYKYEIPAYNTVTTTWTNTGYNPDKWHGNTILRGGLIGSAGPAYDSKTYGISNQSTFSATAMNCSVSATATATNDVGITVPGAISEQKFSYGSWFPTEAQAHTIILRLVGQVGSYKVEKPFTVHVKQRCSTCGKVNKATAKFCSECGTGLLLAA